MRLMSQAEARAYLLRNGVHDARTLDQILRGFDFSHPVYEQPLEPGDVLYQYLRRPSFSQRVPTTGNWFTLSGATTADLAVFDGLSGRFRQKYQVLAHLAALEGTAARLPIDWGWAGGGQGGGTQLLIPSSLLGHLRMVGASELSKGAATIRPAS